jgi:cation diffusion facilitator CzcD-associated flavoprotein CzcO
VHILIIGTGFAGLGMAVRLKQAGIHDFTILERYGEVGGTWRDNHYPGAACDVPSHLYSLSFELKPDWSRMFAPQGEIFDYLKHVADKYGLRPHIRFNTEAKSATFDERTGLWELHTNTGETLRARVVIAGTGPLNRAVYPDLPGLESFEGAKFHSSAWDHETPLDGKRVAVIGTGASAIQIVPTIQPEVSKLTLFQRTAPWVMEKPDFAFSDRAIERFREHPALRKAARYGIYWAAEALGSGFVAEPRILKLREKVALKYLRRVVKDDALRAKLTPTFRMGCKRILYSNDYYPSLVQPNVEVVTEGIRELRAHSIVTSDGVERPIDALVCATGFNATEDLAPFGVRGRHGQDLNEAWKNGAEAYLGCTVSGFPNLFLIIGPNTGLGHTSMVVMIESQIAYILDAIRTMREKSLKLVDVKSDEQDRYNQRLQERLKGTVWTTGCSSWYQNKAGKNVSLWPGFTFEYRLRTRRFDASSYECVPMDATARAAAPRGRPVAAQAS